MKITSTDNTNFSGALNNKLLLKGLEKISDHGATFSAGVALCASVALRPLAIKMTPKVEKENKRYSIASSFASGIAKFLTVAAVSVPLEKAVKYIEDNPNNFLKNNSGFVKDKNAFSFAAQLLKLSAGIVTAIPKSLITISLIPLLINGLYKQKSKENKKEISFTGAIEKIAKPVSKYFNNGFVENFSKKYSSNSTNIARNITVLTDFVLTGMYAVNTKRSKKIEPERKNNLIYNNTIATMLSVGLGLGVDNIVKKQGQGFMDKFVKANALDLRLSKYIQGINILRPAVIFALIYYGILPVISNFTAQRITDFNNKNKEN